MNELTKTGRVKWRPKEWRVEYSRIVGYSALGMGNEAIGLKVGFTKEHVSSILNMPRAKELMAVLLTKLEAKITDNIPEVLNESAIIASKRINEVLKDDVLARKSPFAVAGLALDVLKGVGHLKGGGNGAPVAPNVTNVGAVIISPNQQSSIMDGLQKIQEVRMLHSSPISFQSPVKEAVPVTNRNGSNS